jgi:hypothetical protein
MAAHHARARDSAEDGVRASLTVQASFNEVNQAQQEKEKLINEARRDYNKVIPLAEGEKDQRIREADGYRLKRINEAEGDVARFSALLTEYIKAPVVTRRRIYLETLQDVMPGIRSKIIVDEQTRSILPLLNLDSPKGERPQGAWLKQVVRGFFAYHAVPTNGAALRAFYYYVERIWLRTLRRRSQKDRFSWQRMHRLAADWLPQPRILHPYPDKRFAVTHPRWEPCAGIPPARIWAGGGQ